MTLRSLLVPAVLLVTVAAGPAVAGAPEDFDRVARRILEWQPTAEERRFDEIGWAHDLREARAAGTRARPPRLPLHPRRAHERRAVAEGAPFAMRAGPLSSLKVIEALNRSFVPVYLSNEDRTPPTVPAAPGREGRARHASSPRRGRPACRSVPCTSTSSRPTATRSILPTVAEGAKTDVLTAPPPAQRGRSTQNRVLRSWRRARRPNGPLPTRGGWSSISSPARSTAAAPGEASSRRTGSCSSPTRPGALTSGPPVEAGRSGDVPPETASAHCGNGFYPATENKRPGQEPHRAAHAPGHGCLRGVGHGASPPRGPAPDGHPFYHKDDGKTVEARVSGSPTSRVATRLVRSLRLVTESGPPTTAASSASRWSRSPRRPRKRLSLPPTPTTPLGGHPRPGRKG